MDMVRFTWHVPVPFLFPVVALFSWLAAASQESALLGAVAVSTIVGVDRFPPAVRSLTTFPSVDYGDLYAARTAAAKERSPEEWAREILEAHDSAYRLWSLLGLRLGPQDSGEHVQGWLIAERGDSWIRLETASWYMRAEAVVHVDPEQVSVGVFLHHKNPVAAVVWGPVGIMHRRAVPMMLEQAVSAVERPGSGTS